MIVTQNSFNQKQPPSLKPTDIPGRIVTYAEATEMCARMDLYFMRKRHGWLTGRNAFMMNSRKKTLDKKTLSQDRGGK
ncbi:hypothetical protein EBR66_06440 [bacterium]|nr:hypothetical protein [bacterium]